jgi:hypothetical protein
MLIPFSCLLYDNDVMMSLISIAIVKYSTQNCLNAVVNTELFAFCFKLSCQILLYAVKQGEMDEGMVIVNLTMLYISAICNVLFFIYISII